jgi:hypothetical protein
MIQYMALRAAVPEMEDHHGRLNVIAKTVDVIVLYRLLPLL